MLFKYIFTQKENVIYYVLEPFCAFPAASTAITEYQQKNRYGEPYPDTHIGLAVSQYKGKLVISLTPHIH